MTKLELALVGILVPLFFPFPLFALLGSVDGTSLLVSLGCSYMIGIPAEIFMLAMPKRYWMSNDSDSACEGTPGGN